MANAQNVKSVDANQQFEAFLNGASFMQATKAAAYDGVGFAGDGVAIVGKAVEAVGRFIRTKGETVSEWGHGNADQVRGEKVADKKADKKGDKKGYNPTLAQMKKGLGKEKYEEFKKVLREAARERGEGFDLTKAEKGDYGVVVTMKGRKTQKEYYLFCKDHKVVSAEEWAQQQQGSSVEEEPKAAEQPKQEGAKKAEKKNSRQKSVDKAIKKAKFDIGKANAKAKAAAKAKKDVLPKDVKEVLDKKGGAALVEAVSVFVKDKGVKEVTLEKVQKTQCYFAGKVAGKVVRAKANYKKAVVTMA